MALQSAASGTVLTVRNSEDVRNPAFPPIEIAVPIQQLVAGVEPQLAGAAFAAASRVLVAGRMPVAAGGVET